MSCEVIPGRSYVHGFFEPSDRVLFQSVVKEGEEYVFLECQYDCYCTPSAGEFLITLPVGHYYVYVNDDLLFLIRSPGNKATYELYQLIVFSFRGTDQTSVAIDAKDSVLAATTEPLPDNLHVGLTLGGAADGEFPDIDGIPIPVGGDILVKDEQFPSHDAAHNGIYTLTNAGSDTEPWLLTRRSDSDSTDNMTFGMRTLVVGGDVNAGTYWYLATPDPILVGSTQLSFRPLLKSTTVFGDPSGVKIGLTQTNGLADTAMRSDSAPALDQAIAPVWTEAHIHRKLSSDLVPQTIDFQKRGAVSVEVGSPISPTVNYEAVYQAEYASGKATFDSWASSGWGRNYYTFQYALGATISMFEATEDETYLNYALDWMEAMISAATLEDGDGKKYWRGTLDVSYVPEPIAFMLDEVQGSTELARLARIIITTPALNAVYGTRAQAIYAFVRDHIVNKHLFNRGWKVWMQNNIRQTAHAMSDKTALMIRLLGDVRLISIANGGSDNTAFDYPALLTEFAQGFKDHVGGTARFESFGGGLIWDLGKSQENPYTQLDTDHANRHPEALIDLYRAGIEFDLSYVTGVADLLTNVIWNGSTTDIRFSNFINGDNGFFRTRGPWLAGGIYRGWVKLAQYDQATFELMDATLRQILEGGHPYLSLNNSIHGRIALAGHLAFAAKAYGAGTSGGDSQLPILADSGLGRIGFSGWDGSDYGTGASVDATASEDFGGANHGSRIEIKTTPVGETTPVVGLSVRSGVTIGDAATDPGPGVLDAGVGFRVANGAIEGTVLRGDGIHYVPSVITRADILDLIRFVHEQTVADTLWVVVHGMGSYPPFKVVDDLGQVIYGNANYIDDNEFHIDFTAAVTGKVYI